MATKNSFLKNRDFGLLIIRAGIGISMLTLHGLPKITGGVDKWKAVGSGMKVIGIDFLPVVWGLAAAATETFGSFLLILGLFHRPVSALLAFTMLIAMLVHLNKGDGISVASHAAELGLVFIALIFTGPGKYAVDKK